MRTMIVMTSPSFPTCSNLIHRTSVCAHGCSHTTASRLAKPLMEEWARIDASGVVTAALPRWQLPAVPPYASASELLGYLGRDRTISQDVGDLLLASLIACAPGDELAARVVLQRVLPGLVNVAKRRGGSWEPDRLTAFNESVACAWIVICEYPIARRPRRIASNVVRDAEYAAFVRDRRLRSSTEQVCHTDSMALPSADSSGRSMNEPVSSFEMVVGVLAEARRRGLAEGDLRLAAGLVSGHAINRIADDLGVTTRTVLNRRVGIVARLRELELELELELAA